MCRGRRKAMKVYVLVEYLTPFESDLDATEQVSVLGVYKTRASAEAAWEEWKRGFDSPHEDHEIVERSLKE